MVKIQPVWIVLLSCDVMGWTTVDHFFPPVALFFRQEVQRNPIGPHTPGQKLPYRRVVAQQRRVNICPTCKTVFRSDIRPHQSDPTQASF